MDETDSRHSYVTYFKRAILKVTGYQVTGYVKSSSSTITTHIEKRYMKDTLQLKILWAWTNIRANSFLGKYHKTKMDEGARDYQFQKNQSQFLEEHCTKIFHLIWYSSFSLKQT